MSNLEVATQASGNSKLCLTKFSRKLLSYGLVQFHINVYNFFLHCCNRHRQLQCNYHLTLLSMLPQVPVKLSSITQLIQWSCMYTERKKIHLNFVTTMYCNSNQAIMTVEALPLIWLFKCTFHEPSHSNKFVSTQ